MCCLKIRIFSSIASGIRSCKNACRKLFGKKSAKVSPLSVSSSAAGYVELEDESVQALSLPASDDQAGAIFHRTIPVKLDSPEPSVQTAKMEVFSFSAPNDEDDSNFLLDAVPKAEQSEVPVIGYNLGSSNPWIVDVSWETCNQTSFSYYLVQEKARNHANNSQYTILGPYNPDSAPIEFEEMDLPLIHPLTTTVSLMRDAGYQVLVGKWLVERYPIAILFDVAKAQAVLNQCLPMIGRNFPITIDVGDKIAIDGIVFGYMAAMFLDILNMVLKKQAAANGTLPVNIVAHFHEWTSGSGIMMMKLGSLAKGVTTAYTPHETPDESFLRTECYFDWLELRNLINKFAQDAADLFIDFIIETEDIIDSMYEAAIMNCTSSQTTLYFDITSVTDSTHSLQLKNLKLTKTTSTAMSSLQRSSKNPFYLISSRRLSYPRNLHYLPLLQL